MREAREKGEPAHDRLVRLAERMATNAMNISFNPWREAEERATNRFSMQRQRREAEERLKEERRNRFSMLSKSKPAPLRALHNSSTTGVRLYCFMVASSSDRDLIDLHLKFGMLSGCDTYRIFSSVSEFPAHTRGGRLSSIPVTKVIEGTMDVPRGGKYNTATNTPIFLPVWARILADGEYKRFHWVVKLDPDTVFLASRLRAWLIKDALLHTQPLLLGNAAPHSMALHGPIIVLSRAAADLYATDPNRCKEQVDWSDKGEDWFLDLCLTGVYNVTKRPASYLLADYMQGRNCNIGSSFGKVAYHPFKRTQAMQSCWAQLMNKKRMHRRTVHPWS